MFVYIKGLGYVWTVDANLTERDKEALQNRMTSKGLRRARVARAWITICFSAVMAVVLYAQSGEDLRWSLLLLWAFFTVALGSLESYFYYQMRNQVALRDDLFRTGRVFGPNDPVLEEMLACDPNESKIRRAMDANPAYVNAFLQDEPVQEFRTSGSRDGDHPVLLVAQDHARELLAAADSQSKYLKDAANRSKQKPRYRRPAS